MTETASGHEPSPPAATATDADATAATDADSPIEDPMATGRAAEVDVIALERFASRAGILSKVCFAAGALAVIVVAVSFTGRVDSGVVMYVAPVGALHVWLGVLLGRASSSLADAASARWSERAPFSSAVRELHAALGVQLVVTGFLVFLMALALLVAAAFQRVTVI